MIPIDTNLLALAGAGLPGARPLTRVGWSDRLDDVSAHGLAGFLRWALAAGLVDLDEASTHRLDLQLEAEAIRAVQLEGELVRLRDLLTDLPAVVLKGAVLAHEAYPDPSLRPFTDLDILVTSAHQPDAVEALEALGYVRSRPEPAPGYDARVGKALTLTHPGGVVVDLHRTLVAGNLGDAIDVEEIIARRREVGLGGYEIPGPSWEAHLVETTLHAVMGDGLARALSIRDVVQVALHPDLDPQAAVELVRRWNASEPVAHGLRAVIDGIGIELPGPLGALADEHPALTAALPAPTRSAKRRVDELLHGDVGRRLTLTRALVAPSPAFMRWSYGSRATPRLYGRRWKELYRRALDARGGAPPDAPDSDLVSPPPMLDAPVPRAKLPARSPVEVLALRPADGERLGDRGDARLYPRPRSRQQRWSDMRAQRSNGSGEHVATGSDAIPAPAAAEAAGPTDAGPIAAPPEPSVEVPDPTAGRSQALAGLGLLVVGAALAQAGIEFAGLFLVPAAALLFAVAAGHSIFRRHPDEPWIGQFLVLGVIVKVAASFLRNLTLVVGYENGGDAVTYDEFGHKFAAAWRGNGVVPVLDDLRKTNFVKWFTGVVYYGIGANRIAGFFFFALLAVIGSYFWYRATVDAVPGMNKRLYLALVLFVPSIAFWPSSIGKEALMQLGIGTATLGVSYLLRQRLLLGLAIAAPGGWLLWVVRPHVLALVTIAAGCAYVVGHVRSRGTGVGSLVGRPMGMLVLALLMAFTVSQATKSLGMSEFSLSAVETELNTVSEQTSQGGSQFDSGGNSLSPADLPEGLVTVLLRPLPFEAHSPFELLASIESVLVLVLIIKRFPSVRTSFRQARESPFLLYCIVMLLLYAMTFSSFQNFGLLVRQRSLVMPALFVLIAINPIQPRRRGEPDVSEPESPGVEASIEAAPSP